MPRAVLVSATLLLLCAGCVSYSNLPDAIRVHGSIPQNTQTVSIQSLPMKQGAMMNVEDPLDPPLLLARSLKEVLARKRPGWKIEIDSGQASPIRSDIAVRAEIVEVDGGSAGARFWIGFNAGAAQSTIRVSILDRAGKELAVAPISHSTMCPLGWCTDSNKMMIQRNLQSLAEEVAEFVVNPSEYEKRKEAR